MLPGRTVSFIRSNLALLISICFLSVAALGADPVVSSTWKIPDPVVDGVNSEWTVLTSLEKGPAVAVANDDQFAYVIVSTSDQQLRRRLGRGLIAWFDPTHKKRNTFGIRIPGAARPPLGGVVAEPSEGSLITPPRAGTNREQPIDEFDILGPGKNERHLVTLEPKLGIELATSTTEGALAFELKVPLARTEGRAYAIGAAPGATISLGLTSIEPARSLGSRGGGRLRGGFQFEQYGRGGGGRGGGGYGAGRGSQGEALKPLSLWLTVKLAAAPPK